MLTKFNEPLAPKYVHTLWVPFKVAAKVNVTAWLHAAVFTTMALEVGLKVTEGAMVGLRVGYLVGWKVLGAATGDLLTEGATEGALVGPKVGTTPLVTSGLKEP